MKFQTYNVHVENFGSVGPEEQKSIWSSLLHMKWFIKSSPKSLIKKIAYTYLCALWECSLVRAYCNLCCQSDTAMCSMFCGGGLVHVWWGFVARVWSSVWYMCATELCEGSWYVCGYPFWPNVVVSLIQLYWASWVCACVLGCAPKFSINLFISAHPLFLPWYSFMCGIHSFTCR